MELTDQCTGEHALKTERLSWRSRWSLIQGMAFYHSSALLRFGLASFLSIILLILGSLNLPSDPANKYHTLHLFFLHLNFIFKQVGWLMTSVTWVFSLIARYLRQYFMKENASWRRHAVIDGCLVVFSWIYWFVMSHLFIPWFGNNNGKCLVGGGASKQILPLNRDSCVNGQWIPFDISGHIFLSSLGIIVLVEEIIRSITRPAAHFVFPAHLINKEVRRCRIVWTLAVTISLLVITSLMLIYGRTCLWYHTLGEKIVALGLSFLFWIIILAFRFFLR